MTQENLDRPTRRRIKRKKLKNGKRRVFIRTEWRTGHGTVYSEWLELRDDPKNGVYDLTNWNKKFHPFGGRYSSRKHYPSRYRTDETKENGKSSSSPYPHMCSFDEEEFYNFFAKHKGRYSQLVKLRIKSGELQDYLQDEALDAICDGVRVAYLKYDPKHPPKFCLERGGNVKSASLETFLEHVARHALSDFIDYVSAEKRDFNKVAFTTDDETEGDGVDVEMLKDERRNTLYDRLFWFDIEVLRERLSQDLRDVLDKLLKGDTHYAIYTSLRVSRDRYRKDYLAPIQNLAAELGFEPTDFHMFIDKMFAFRYMLNKRRRERNTAEEVFA